jgi:hypothetical protein
MKGANDEAKEHKKEARKIASSGREALILKVGFEAQMG